MPVMGQVLLAVGVVALAGGTAWVVCRRKDDNAHPGAFSGNHPNIERHPGCKLTYKKQQKVDVWRKVILASGVSELISAMNGLYPNGKIVSIDSVFAIAQSHNLCGEKCTAAINAVVNSSEGRLQMLCVKCGDRWVESNMQNSGVDLPPAACVSKVISQGMKDVMSGHVVVKAMVELDSNVL